MKKISAFILTVLMAVFTVSSLTACGTESSDNTFKVGFDADFPPMGFKDENGGYTGFDLELAEEAAKRMGMEFEAVPIAWDAKDQELESGNISCIWNGFTIQGREDKYTWSRPYLNNKQVFVVMKASGITDTAGLSGKIVDVQTDSSAQAALDENTALSDTFGGITVVSDYNTALMDLEAGSADAVAMDEIVAAYEIQQKENGDDFLILDESIADEEYGIGFKLGNTELRDKVEKALDEMKADGTIAEISTKWFGSDITTY